MSGFREAFPNLKFWGAADLIAEGDYVVRRWEGGGTHRDQPSRTSWLDLFQLRPAENAVHGNDRIANREWQDRGGDRSG